MKINQINVKINNRVNMKKQSIISIINNINKNNFDVKKQSIISIINNINKNSNENVN